MGFPTPHGGRSRLRPEQNDRDRHLTPAGPKRILSLDGGGVRGVITIGLLRGVEDILRARSPDPDAFRLSDYFDLIGGTSTGSIIASLLALGKSVDEIEKLYLQLAPEIFGRPQAVGVHKPKFDAGNLEEFIKVQLGDLKLGDEQFKTGFALFTKRVDTGAPWMLSNHPDSRYWETQAGKDLPNKLYPVGGLVRASAAAPYYFDAAEITISEGGAFEPDIGIFFDGAVAAANNPSLHLLVLATLGDHPFQWSASPDNLLVVSVGTGAKRLRISRHQFYRNSILWGLGNLVGGFRNATRAVAALQAMIGDTESHTLTVMQSLSLPPDPATSRRAHINSEIGVMPHAPIGGAERALCTFHRIDASLESSDVEPLLLNAMPKQGPRLRAISRMAAMDNGDPKNLRRLLLVGRHNGASIRKADFPATFDPW